MSARPHLEDLMARARRGELNAEEERQLSLATEASLEARLLYEAGRDFDCESPVLLGDEALIERLAKRAEARQHKGATRHQRRTPKRRPALVGAAAVFIAGAAAASWVATRSKTPAEQNTEARISIPSQMLKPRVQASTPIPPAPSTQPEPDLPATTEIAEPAEPPSQVPSTRLAPAKLPKTDGARKEESSSTLFSKANAARRNGQTALALKLYSELRTRHPNSAEARQATLSSAELELGRGAARRALALFRRYGKGPLAAEATWGEARALRRLGRSGEERSALRRLVHNYPDSAYAGAARTRLETDGD